MTANQLLFVCGVLFMAMGGWITLFGKTGRDTEGGCALLVLGLAGLLTAIFRPI